MKPEDAASKVLAVLSRELEDDYVEPWKITWHLRRLLPSASDLEIQEIGQSILRDLVASGALLGELSPEGAFIELDPRTSLDDALTKWRRLGRDPNMGDLPWLTK